MKIVKKKKWDYKNWFFLLLGTSWLSGIIFFILRSFVSVEGEFGLESHPLQFPILKIHGASSFLIMVVFGYFIAAHVKKSFYSRNPKPKSGLVLLVMPIIMIITAYCLYYLGDGILRQIMFYSHLMTGFFLPMVLIIHIMLMKPKKKNKIKICQKKEVLGGIA